jgi:hypothetical protein
MRLDRDGRADAAPPAGEGAGACSLVGREAGEDALQRLVREGAQTVRVPPPLIRLGRFDSMATPWYYVRDSVFIFACLGRRLGPAVCAPSSTTRPTGSTME